MAKEPSDTKVAGMFGEMIDSGWFTVVYGAVPLDDESAIVSKMQFIGQHGGTSTVAELLTAINALGNRELQHIVNKKLVEVQKEASVKY